MKDTLAEYEYDNSYVETIEKKISSQERQNKLLQIDFEMILKKLMKAESVIKTIFDTYALHEAKGYYNDSSK